MNSEEAIRLECLKLSLQLAHAQCDFEVKEIVENALIMANAVMFGAAARPAGAGRDKAAW